MTNAGIKLRLVLGKNEQGRKKTGLRGLVATPLQDLLFHFTLPPVGRWQKRVSHFQTPSTSVFALTTFLAFRKVPFVSDMAITSIVPSRICILSITRFMAQDIKFHPIFLTEGMIVSYELFLRTATQLKLTGYLLLMQIGPYVNF